MSFWHKVENGSFFDVLAYISVRVDGTSACNGTYEKECQGDQFDVFCFGFGRGCDVIAT